MTMDSSPLDDPLTMSDPERGDLQFGPNVDIICRFNQEENEDSAISDPIVTQHTLPARLLMAFSRVARNDLGGIRSGDHGCIELEGLHPAAVVRFVSYIRKVGAAKTGTQVPEIFTDELSWDVWIDLYRVVVHLDAPIVLTQLLKQIKSDLRSLDLPQTLYVWNLALQKHVDAPVPTLVGRLFGFASSKINKKGLGLRDVDLMVAEAPNEDFTKKAIRVWAMANYSISPLNEDEKLASASAPLRHDIQRIWQSRRSEKASRAHEVVERRQQHKEREANVLVTWDMKTGREKRIYR